MAQIDPPATLTEIPAMMTIVKPRRFRALDWTLTALTMMMGCLLLLPGDSLSTAPVAFALTRVFREDTWGVILVTVATLRMIGLVINGRLPHGSPILRGIGALSASIIWSQFFVSALNYSFLRGAASPSLAYLIILTF